MLPMNQRRFLRSCILVFVLGSFPWVLPLFLGAFGLMGALSAAPDKPRPFDSEIRAFAESDRSHPPQPGGILFVGSSIFREWTNVAAMMSPLPVSNRAFGGSRTADQLTRFDQVVVPHAPRIIVYYCGSNDLKAGDAPADIFARFKAFSERVRERFPQTHLVYVSSTRAPDRVKRWEQVDHYNALVRAYCSQTPLREFIDINPVLVDDQGHPRLDLFRSDRLHFHPQAYQEFAGVIRPVLEHIWAKQAGVPAPGRRSAAGPAAHLPTRRPTLANG